MSEFRTSASTLVHLFQTDDYGTKVRLSDADYEELFPTRRADDIQLGTPIEWFGATLRYTGSEYQMRGENGSRELADDAIRARENGSWYNSTISPGAAHGPFSGDSMTSQIAFGASINAVATAAGRPALEIANR